MIVVGGGAGAGDGVHQTILLGTKHPFMPTGVAFLMVTFSKGRIRSSPDHIGSDAQWPWLPFLVG